MAMEHSEKQLIRGIVEGLLRKIRSPFTVFPYAQDLHDLCCAFATEHGYPMGTDPSEPSLRLCMPRGVILASVSYGYIEDDATRIFISIYTAFITYIDDAYTEDSKGVSVFTEQFIRREKQLDPVLDGFASFLLSIPDYYGPVEGNIILATTLNFISSMILDIQTQGIKVSLHATRYPEFMRLMSGLAPTYMIMAFAPIFPVQTYIQCIPEGARYINFVNDVMSFYKEELAHDALNHITVVARSSGISKMGVLEQVANDAVHAHEQVCKILEADKEAYEVWQKFKDGFAAFHISSKRYLLDDLMN
ncbi:isoprenoid synthase domain-containing protein [Pholiota molesta]|nr:isoprenoid synthase domain-containing protein [Pholiota molesta]